MKARSPEGFFASAHRPFAVLTSCTSFQQLNVAQLYCMRWLESRGYTTKDLETHLLFKVAEAALKRLLLAEFRAP